MEIIGLWIIIIILFVIVIGIGLYLNQKSFWDNLIQERKMNDGEDR